MAQRWRRWLFYAVLPILVGLNAWQLRIETDLSAFMIAGQSTEELLLASEMRSGALSRRYILSVGQDAAKKIDFSLFVQKFLQQLQTTDGIISVWRVDRQAEAFEAVAFF